MVWRPQDTSTSTHAVSNTLHFFFRASCWLGTASFPLQARCCFWHFCVTPCALQSAGGGRALRASACARATAGATLPTAVPLPSVVFRRPCHDDTQWFMRLPHASCSMWRHRRPVANPSSTDGSVLHRIDDMVPLIRNACREAPYGGTKLLTWVAAHANCCSHARMALTSRTGCSGWRPGQAARSIAASCAAQAARA